MSRPAISVSTVSAAKPVTTTTSVIPASARCLSCQCSTVRPESSTRHLGRVSVRGDRRLPWPALRMMALAGFATAKRLAILPNTLSTQLAILDHAGLVHSRRDGRSIIYTADYGAMQGLLGFLLEDCCGGSPEICGPLGEVLDRVACCPAA
jgi:DNA-binding transcriptional ArsR family regulator